MVKPYTDKELGLMQGSSGLEGALAAECLRERRRHKRKTKAVLQLLEEILNHQVSNRHAGYGYRFYRCWTYPSGGMPDWVGKAEKLLAKGVEP